MHTQVEIIGAGSAGLSLGQMLHRFPGESVRLSTPGKAAMTSLAENYVGLPIDITF